MGFTRVQDILQNPPNFLIQSDLRTYVTQEVVVPQEVEEEHPAEASLIDTSDVADTIDSHSSNSASPSPAHQEVIAERDFLRSQCEKLRYLDNTVVGRR